MQTLVLNPVYKVRMGGYPRQQGDGTPGHLAALRALFSSEHRRASNANHDFGPGLVCRWRTPGVAGMLGYRQKRCACAWEALAFHAGQVGEDGHDLYRQIRGGSVGSELSGQGQSSAGAHVSCAPPFNPD